MAESSGNDTNEDKRPKQLYRPRRSLLEAYRLLECEDLTQQDVNEFCRQNATVSISTRLRSKNHEFESFHHRRKEVLELRKSLATGHARMDEDGRLLPVSNPRAPPQVNLPPPPAPRNPLVNHNNQPHGDLRNNPNRNNNNNNNHHNAHRNAAEAGAEDRLTVRRICIAVSGVAMAFLFLMLHTLPIGATIFFHSAKGTNSHSHGFFKTQQNPWDVQLLYELFHIREFEVHATECGMDRNQTFVSSIPLWSQYLWRPNGRSVDCSDGVLIIPNKSNILRWLLRHLSEHRREKRQHQDTVNATIPAEKGVDVTWFMDCQPPSTVASSSFGSSIEHHHYPGIQPQYAQREECLDASGPEHTENSTCSATSVNKIDSFVPKPVEERRLSCFRGIHDGILSSEEIASVHSFGKELIRRGGDHFDVYEASSRLQNRLPEVVQKLRSLLQTRYGIGTATTLTGNELSPVAFRIYVTAPMNGASVTSGHGRYQQTHRLVGLLNLTNYVDYIDRVAQKNEIAATSWPFRIEPYRDPCHLMADLQADPRFGILTTAFLSDGSGEDYFGGTSLFVDGHPSNSNPQRKIRRGVVIDGSAGRVVVSTGGYENQRCSLPVLGGIRVTLQVWWN